MNLDEGRLHQVVQHAFDVVAGDRRWQTAITKARQQLEHNPYLHWNGERLLVLSDSNEIYAAGRTCECKSFLRGKPCWHRAAARLLQRYFETTPC